MKIFSPQNYCFTYQKTLKIHIVFLLVWIDINLLMTFINSVSPHKNEYAITSLKFCQ